MVLLEEFNFTKNVKIPHEWTDYTYHIGSSCDDTSIIEGGLIAGGSCATKKTNMLLHSREPAEQFDDHSSLGTRRTKNASKQIEMEKSA